MKIKKTSKVILKNIKFMIPLFLKKSPITLVFMLLAALSRSLFKIGGMIIPAMLIKELLGEKNIQTIVILVVITVIGGRLLSYIDRIVDSVVSYYARKMDFEIDKMLSDKIMTVDYFNLEDPQFIDMMNRAKKGMNEYSNGVYSFIYALQSIISSIITIFGVIGVVAYSKQYFVMALAFLAIISNALIQKIRANVNQEFRNSYVRYGRKLWYYVKSIAYFTRQKDLRLNDGKQLILDSTNDFAPKAYKLNEKNTIKSILLSSADDIIYYILIQFITLLTLGYNCIKKIIDIATFQMLFSSIGTLNGAVGNLIYSVNDYIKACEYQSDFIDLMKLESIFKNGNEKLENIDTIEFKNVSFKYPRTEKYILKNLNFKIDNKQKVSLVGLNGSGKTTIIKLLCRFYPLEEGEILVNGININDYEYQSYMSKISIVFQDFMIISFTVRSNVAIVDRNQEKLYDCLQRAQVLDKIQSLPDKENTYINKWFDKSGVTFSGGEMQKFAIARSLYKDSDFVVMDEPTSSLDPMSEAKIYYNYNEIVGKKLTLFISHRLSSCIFSDRIMVLDGEKIVEEGTHKELMQRKDGLYYKMFTSQAAYYNE